PRSGYPGGHWLSLTAIADNATDAEAISTACFLSSQEDLEAELFDDEGKVKPEAPCVIAMTEGDRQDAVHFVTFGNIHWIDPPEQDPPS
ncbi:MAG: hypothetical protein AAF802_24650, partial [Planctomycetota bacterium]